MYMEDIKIFAKNEKELDTQIQTIRIYSQDVRYEFDNEKCALLIMKSRKRETIEGKNLANQESIRMEVDTIKQRWKKKYKNITSEEWENFSKLSSAAEISSKE